MIVLSTITVLTRSPTSAVSPPERCILIFSFFNFSTNSFVPLIIDEITLPSTRFLFLPIVDEIIKLSTAPTQIKSSKFITKESCAIPFQTERSPVSFQYMYARELLVPAPSACITIQCSSDPEM